MKTLIALAFESVLVAHRDGEWRGERLAALMAARFMATVPRAEELGWEYSVEGGKVLFYACFKVEDKAVMGTWSWWEDGVTPPFPFRVGEVLADLDEFEWEVN